MAATPIDPPLPRRPAGTLVLALGVAGVWLVLMNQLRVEWTLNEQYNYGWGVPLLAAYLLLRRRDDRPEPEPVAAPGTLIAFVLFAGAAALLLPARLVMEANPDWRLAGWATAALAITLTLTATWLAGGRAWLRHFAVPLGFLLLAVPWPSGIEHRLIQTFMQWVATATVEVLNWLGVLARQRGNLIELANGIVGIDEACSGVRSFQSTVMISLFLGELHRLAWPRRAALFGLGVALAFVLNLGRSFFLTWQCVRGGTTAIHSWHDPAGYAVFGLSFLGLVGLAHWLRRGTETATVAAPETAARNRPPAAVPLAWAAAFAGWVLLVEAANAGWYRYHERADRPSAGWTIRWPETEANFRNRPIADETRRILRYSAGGSASWQAKDGAEWLAFFFRWNPGSGSAMLARGHTPEVCMPASGMKLVADHGLELVPAGPLQLPFRSYTFTQRGQPLHIFFCLWEDQVRGETPDLSRQRATLANRLRAVQEGRRHLGQQVFQVVIAGAPDIAEARRKLSSALPGLLRTGEK